MTQSIGVSAGDVLFSLRLCMMSATLDGDVLASYFGARGFEVPRVSFPGRTFPVTQLYLEDALRLTGHAVRRGCDWHIDSPAARKRAEQAAAAAAARSGVGGAGRGVS